MNNIDRYQMNRNVNGVLVRHATDLSRLNYSFSGRILYVYGFLAKDPAGEMTSKEVSALVDELVRIPRLESIQFDLDNWNIASAIDSWEISKKAPLKPSTSDRGLVLHLPDGEISRENVEQLTFDESEDPGRKPASDKFRLHGSKK
jgi:hypothetical protein